MLFTLMPNLAINSDFQTAYLKRKNRAISLGGKKNTNIIFTTFRHYQTV
jgi:hypothetical protein